MLYKRILVPVDGSNTSGLALREALRIVKNQQAAMRIVHVVDEAVIDGDIDGLINYAALRDAMKQGGQHLLSKDAATAKQAGIEAETVLLETMGERIGSVIAEESKRWQADLIVIGTHGRRGLDRLFMGSVAESTARYATVPLLLVKGA